MALRREFGHVQAAHCWPADRLCLLPQLQQDTNRRGDDGSVPSWSAARCEACDGYQLANDTLTMLKGHSDPFTATRNRFLDTLCLLKQTAQSKLSPVFSLSLSSRNLGNLAVWLVTMGCVLPLSVSAVCFRKAVRRSGQDWAWVESSVC